MALNWGIIGPGIIANKFANALKINKSNLLAVASRSKDRGEEFAKKHSVERVYDSYDKLLADDDIDVVYISIPHSHHAEWIIKALNAKKHVLCEKPITTSSKELQECIEASKRNNRFLMEAMWTRFLPMYRETVKEILDKDILGEIRIINIDYSFLCNPDPEYRLLNKNLAGGALLDVGVYAINLVDIFLGKPKEIKAVAHIGETGVDLQSAIAMKFDNKAVATITNGIAVTGEEIAQIIGTKGKLILRSFGRCELAELTLNCQKTKKIVKEFENGFQYEIAEVERCILEKKAESKIMPLSKSLEIQGIVDEIQKQFYE
jgi:predicted dehydrogenase